ncbi:hypothetical protein BD626DRAFT_635678 [Schizophyllum amplum]|uniref:Uncharacterized protein n=1 Tax=Schizophyllum amplum TaxID=97359 RepID=A0A550BVJ5_9AGAR|nr:hypothetical protein BD626DRAFT_635678 [Auriculariopsis ampla]
MPPPKSATPSMGQPRTLQVASHIKTFDLVAYSRSGHHLASPEGRKSPFFKDNIDQFHRPTRDVFSWGQVVVEDTAFATIDHLEIYVKMKQLILAMQSPFAPDLPPTDRYPEAQVAAAEAAKEEEVEVVTPPKPPRAARGKKPLLIPGVQTPDVLLVVDKKPTKRALADALDAAGPHKLPNITTYGQLKLEHGAANTEAIFTALLGTDAASALEKVAETIAKASSFGSPKPNHLSAMLKDLDSQLATTACALGVHYLVHQHLQEQRDGVAALLAGLPSGSAAGSSSTESGKAKGKGKGKRAPKSKAVISDEMDVDTQDESAPQADDEDAEGSDAETVMPATDA